MHADCHLGYLGVYGKAPQLNGDNPRLRRQRATEKCGYAEHEGHCPHAGCSGKSRVAER